MVSRARDQESALAGSRPSQMQIEHRVVLRPRNRQYKDLWQSSAVLISEGPRDDNRASPAAHPAEQVTLWNLSAHLELSSLARKFVGGQAAGF